MLGGALLLERGDGALEFADAVAQGREVLEHALLLPILLGALLECGVRVTQAFFEAARASLVGREFFADTAVLTLGIEPSLLHGERALLLGACPRIRRSGVAEGETRTASGKPGDGRGGQSDHHGEQRCGERSHGLIVSGATDIVGATRRRGAGRRTRCPARASAGSP
ncbi:hypothetical protein GCM10009847_00360 [Leucobacter tardus]